MGYMDWLERRCYQTDPQGRTIYFPCGMAALGRVVPDDATKAAIRRQTQPRLVIAYVGLPLIHYALSLLIAPTTPRAVALATIPFVVLWAVEYGLKVRRLVSLLTPSEERWSHPSLDFTSLREIIFRYGVMALFMVALTVPFGLPSIEWFARAESSAPTIGMFLVGLLAFDLLSR